MAWQWKPGDVALMSYTDTTTGVVLRMDDGLWHDARGFEYEDGVGIAPVVVLNPDDVEQVERLAHAAFQGTGKPLQRDTTMLQAALRSLVADPKPDEPQGLGAVVEDGYGRLWTRSAMQASVWRPVFRNAEGKTYYVPDPVVGAGKSYDEITAVRVLSEGWSE